MSKETNEILEFGPFRLDTGEALLTRQGAPVPLAPKVFDLLVYLASRAGRLVDKEELLKALWPDSFVEEANLTVNMAALRKALGPQPDGQSWIETVPKRGYRFLATVARPAVEAPVEPAPPTSLPPTVAPSRPHYKYQIAAAAVLLLAGIFVYWRWPLRRPPLSPRQSIAVLPFQDLSPAEDLHAGLGMTDALVTRLSAIPELMVRPVATVRKYDRSAADPLEAGRALGVETVLTGSIQSLDKRIRVTVSLLRVQDGQSLWADKFDEFSTNLFAVQDAISEKLAKVLALRLTSEDQDRMMRRYTESTEAFRLYELGRYERYIDAGRARDYYQRAIREDPRYALPYVELADIYVSLSGNGIEAFRREAPLAREAAAMALRLAPDLAEAHAAMAEVKRVIDRDFAGAERELYIAMRLNPASAKMHDDRARLRAIQGDLSTAIQESRIAAAMDPFNGEYAYDVSWFLYCARQYPAALATIDEFHQRDPRDRTDWMRFYLYLKMSRVPEATALMENYTKTVGTRPYQAALAHAYALGGKPREARELLKSLPPDWGFYQRAVVEITLGDRDAALAHLDQAVDERSVWIEWIKVDPDLDPLHGDPRFEKIVVRMGLVQ